MDKSNQIEVKTFEVRDEMTFISVLAINGIVSHIPEPDHYLIRRSGWIENQMFTYVMKLSSSEIHFDPCRWGDSRTMINAHKYIQEHWDELESGDVVDVQFILGETEEPAVSDRFVEADLIERMKSL